VEFTTTTKPAFYLVEGDMMATRLRHAPLRAVAATWSQLSSGILSRGAVSFLFATAGVNVSNFFFHIVISRLLGPAHYGAVGAILSILSLLTVPVGAAQLAVTQAVIGHTENNQSFSLSRLIWRALVIGVVASLAFAGLAPTIDGFLHIGSPLPLFLVSAWIPLATVGAVLQGSLIGEYRFRAVAFATFGGGGPIRLLFGAGMVAAGFGVSGAIVATIGAQAFTTGSLLFSARKKVRSHPEGSVVRANRRDMVLSVASLGSYTAFVGVDTFLARHFFSATVAGQYAAGAVAAHIALFIPGAIVTIAFPHWASGHGTSSESRKVFMQALKITTLVGLITAGALTLLSSLVVHLLFGSSYSSAIAIVGLLAFASAAIGILSLFVFLHLARRSLVALTPWLGVALAIVLISLRHQSMTSVAVIMLIVSVLTLFAAGIPALLALVRASTRDAGINGPWSNLRPADLDLTMVIPFDNPGSHFGSHIGDLMEILSKSGFSYEVLAVSYGSTDHSEDPLTAFDANHLTFVRLDVNQGKGAALRAGLSLGRGEYLGFIDGDGDIPAEALIDFLDIMRREQPDIILGSKRHPRSEVAYPPLRRVYSWGYQQINRTLFGLPIRDTQTGVKIVRRDVLSIALPLMVEKRFAFDLELFVVARKQGFRNFIEMPVKFDHRFTRTISLRSVKAMFIDTLAIFYRLRILRYYDRDLQKNPDESLLFESSSDENSLTSASLDSTISVPDSESMRILIFTWRDLAHTKAGGAEIYTNNVAREWVRAGHDVTLFCAAVEGRPEKQEDGGVHIIRRGTRFSVYREAKRFYLREGRGNFDLVIDEGNTRPFLAPKWVEDTPVTALTFQVCRELWRYQMPFPLSFIGRYWLEPKWLRAYVNTPTVTISESSKESLEAYGLKRVVVVPIGQNPLRTRPNVPRESRPTIVFVSRLEAHKRPNDAIRAFEVLRERMPEAVMWIIGSGPMEDELRRSAPEGVVFLGKVSPERKLERLARAHVLVATSVREGWGLVISEAASVGTPSIAYDVAGLRDSVRASQGYLTATDPVQLGNTLQELLEIWLREGLPTVSPLGVLPWKEVARRILMKSEARVLPVRTTIESSAATSDEELSDPSQN
jgi:glycosyltransferase involved in cell wall biosynthesis/O-antigen/teichoic acid export membrane protein